MGLILYELPADCPREVADGDAQCGSEIKRSGGGGEGGICDVQREESPCNDKVKVKAADVEKVPASRQFSSNTRMALGWPRMAWDDQW